MHLRLATLILLMFATFSIGNAQELTEDELFGTEDPSSQQTIDDLEKQIEKELSTTQDPGLNQQLNPPAEVAKPEPKSSKSIKKKSEEPANETVPESETIVEEPIPVAPTEVAPRERELPASEPEEPLRSLELESAQLTYPADVDVQKSVFDNEPEKNCQCSFNYLKPYSERRSTIGFNLAVGYSSYSPLDYKPDFVVNNSFDNYFGAAETPLIEVTLGPKLNMSFGSIALDLGAGYYNNENRDKGNLKLIPVRAGATYAMDNLSRDPVLVPYASAGAYVVYYEEKLASQKVGGNTSPGLYYAGGLAIQLNWLDETSASIAYDETGLENTFLFAEGRSFVLAGNVPNLSSEIQWGAGLRLEY
jgi:hypothetical protein